MSYAVWLALLLGVLLPALVPVTATRAAPAPAAVTVTLLGVVATCAGLASLLLVGATLILSAAHRLVSDPVPAGLAVTAAPVALLLLAVCLRTTSRELALLLRVDRLLPAGTAIAVSTDGPLHAHAVSGLRRGRVEVSADLLSALSPRERQALLAHERAHLRGRHSLLRAAAEVCAAVHPLLRALPARVEKCCERWADESAAVEVGERRVVAQALTRAALVTVRASSGPVHAPAFTTTAVTGRVEALLAPPPSPRRGALLVGAACTGTALAVACAGHAGWDLLGLLTR